MNRNDEVKLAVKLIKEYCEKSCKGISENTYEEVAKKIVDLSYSLGGHPSCEILNKMIPTYIDGSLGKNNQGTIL